MATDALVMRDVNTFYGESHVLRDLSLTLRPSALLAMLGRNGVGKTTCMASIAGFVRPRSGMIEVFGAPIARLAPERIVAAGVALVPQGRRVFPTLTVAENLQVAARAGSRASAHGQGWSLARVFSTFPRLSERRRQLAGHLSGGEQQMLAIGRALMTNPRVLLLDEPSEGLAPQIVAELKSFILTLKQEGLSIILVEQNSTFALEVADDAVILATSGLSYDGRADTLGANPRFIDQQLGVI